MGLSWSVMLMLADILQMTKKNWLCI